MNGQQHRFLVFNNGADVKLRVLIFATNECLQHLGTSKNWFMDRNFVMAPPLFVHMIIIQLTMNLFVH